MEQDRPKILFVPPLAWLLSVAATLALTIWLPLDLLPGFLQWPALLVGLAILGFAIWLNVSGFLTFQREGTHVNPYKPALKVVRSGPYRFTRNPMYLGMVLFPVGLGLVLASLWGLFLGALLWAALHYGVVLREEEYMLQKFGEDYSDLVKVSRRWL